MIALKRYTELSLIGLVCAGVVAIRCGLAVAPADVWPDAPSSSDDAFLRAESGEQLNNVVGRVFRKLSDPALRHWRESPSRSAAFAGAWQEVVRTIGTGTRPKPDREMLSRFFGFAEGRLGVVLPKWWEAAVFRVEANVQKTLLFPLSTADSPYLESLYPFHLRPSDLSRFDEVANTQPILGSMVAPRNALIREHSKGWQISVGEKSLIVDQDTRVKLGDISNMASVYIGETRGYFAFHSRRCLPFTLFCVNRQDGQLLWSTKVWGNGGLYDYAGVGYHWVEIKETKREVLVFGVGEDNAYIEGFSRHDGICTVRFGSLYGSLQEPSDVPKKKGD